MIVRPGLRPTLTVREAALLLGVSERSVYRWVAEGVLPAVRIRRTRRVLALPLLRLLEEDR